MATKRRKKMGARAMLGLPPLHHRHHRHRSLLRAVPLGCCWRWWRWHVKSKRGQRIVRIVVSLRRRKLQMKRIDGVDSFRFVPPLSSPLPSPSFVWSIWPLSMWRDYLTHRCVIPRPCHRHTLKKKKEFVTRTRTNMHSSTSYLLLILFRCSI